MALHRVPGSKHYRADSSGLASVALSGQVQSMAVTAAQRVAVQATTDGDQQYTAEPATVRGGWQNEPRAGAVVREDPWTLRSGRVLNTPMITDRKGRVLITALDAVTRTPSP
ncbi:hypothetical protein [Micrococcus sp.]|uniref:hypothetical protein n=1 Tax=Micrococcus sp. TaxID=1271 RepID=UPI0026DD7743|nr:hypothetical protein [Micrococcus sp.]MDO4240628.1 hypothetical protein [Micrococcus sp.]